jgi:hypothetical protein
MPAAIRRYSASVNHLDSRLPCCQKGPARECSDAIHPLNAARRIHVELRQKTRQVVQRRKWYAKLEPDARSTSILSSLASKSRLAEIEFVLDPAPRLVLQLALAIQVVDVLSFRGDQL